MVAWVVINRQHLPRAARGPSQPRKSRPIRALPLAARLFNNPTFKPANDPQFPPASIPILELTPPSSHRKSPPSFHALTWNPFCNPFVFIFMHVMGGYPSLCGNYKSWPQIVRGQPLSHNMLWSRRTKTEYPHRLVYPPPRRSDLQTFQHVSYLSPFFSIPCALIHTTAASQPLSYLSLPHSFHHDGGCGSLPSSPERIHPACPDPVGRFAEKG